MRVRRSEARGDDHPAVDDALFVSHLLDLRLRFASTRAHRFAAKLVKTGYGHVAAAHAGAVSSAEFSHRSSVATETRSPPPPSPFTLRATPRLLIRATWRLSRCVSLPATLVRATARPRTAPVPGAMTGKTLSAPDRSRKRLPALEAPSPRAADLPHPRLPPATDREGVPEAVRRERRVRGRAMPPRTRLSVAFPASPSRRHHSRNASLTALSPPIPSSGSPPPPRGRSPARTAPATLRTSASGSRPPSPPSRVRLVAARAPAFVRSVLAGKVGLPR